MRSVAEESYYGALPLIPNAVVQGFGLRILVLRFLDWRVWGSGVQGSGALGLRGLALGSGVLDVWLRHTKASNTYTQTHTHTYLAI